MIFKGWSVLLGVLAFIIALACYFIFFGPLPPLKKCENAPQEFQGHAVPQLLVGESIHFKFEVYSRNEMHPTSNNPDDLKKKNFLVQPTLWQSTCAGQLNYSFSGYVEEEGLDFPLAHYLYSVKDLKFEERSFFIDHQKKGIEWEERYGKDGEPVQMLRNKTKRVDHMNEMIGKPQDWYVDKDSLAKFYPDGRAARTLEGNIKSLEKAKYMTGSWVIGQYFFKGIQYEALAHHMGIMTPPKAAVEAKRATSWQSAFPALVDDPKDSEGKMIVHWNFDGMKKHEGEDVLHIRFQSFRQLPQAKAIGSGEVLQAWNHQIKGSAYLDAKTYLPHKIDMKRNVSWVDVMQYQRKGKPLKHQLLLHQWSNHIIMTRQLDQKQSGS